MLETSKHVVVVGASLAGLRAVETARELGFEGRLTLIGSEVHLPYDRPPLSKAYLEAGAAIPHFDSVHDLADRLDLDLVLGKRATALDVAQKHLSVGDDVIDYDELLIATGVNARTLPGTAHLEGVHTLRNLDDADAVRTALDAGARTVIIGAGFIGSEVAAAVRRRGLPVTILEAQATPLVRSVGEHAGAALSMLHTRRGTDLRCGVGVESLFGRGHVQGVRLVDGTTIPADLVIVGVGASPATSWLQSSGVDLDSGVVCDQFLRAAPSVWAAGDVARWWHPRFERHLRLEHWTNATEMGAHAMENLLGQDDVTPYTHIPYFWSEWYDDWIQFAGLPTGEPTVVSGAWDSDTFVALYRDHDRLSGVLTLNRRGDIMKYRNLVGRGTDWDDALVFAAAREARAAATR